MFNAAPCVDRCLLLVFAAFAIGLSGLFCGTALCEELPEEQHVFSGPQPGEVLPRFAVRTVVGPGAGSETDFIAQAGAQPVLLIFVRERTRPAFGLANLLTRFAATRESAGLHRGLIFLSDDLTETEAWIKRIPQYFEKGTPVGISVDGAEGPGAYGLNRNVALTVLVGKDGRTTANFALVQPSIPADGPKIVQAIVDATGGGAAPDITKFLPEGMRDRQRPASRETGEDVRLRELLRNVIRKEATDEEVSKAAKAIEEYVARNSAARIELGRIAQRVVGAETYREYGTAPARKKLKVWADTYGPDAPEAGKPAAPKPDEERPRGTP